MRTVRNMLSMIEEHLEAMQRDVHGLEYEPWKNEVDTLWKKIFNQIDKMTDRNQPVALETIRELWTLYVAHYVVVSG